MKRTSCNIYLLQKAVGIYNVSNVELDCIRGPSNAKATDCVAKSVLEYKMNEAQFVALECSLL